MCDHGRLDYRWMNRRDRVEQPMVMSGGSLAATGWDIALRAAATLLRGKRAHVLASPNLSNEALFLLATLVGKTGGRGAVRVNQGGGAPPAGGDGLALRAGRAGD